MSEELLIRFCSPTLAGIKTGNCFSCPYSDKTELISSIRALNKRLCPKGVTLVPLRISDGRALVYAFRFSRLKKDLSCDESARILEQFGYSCTNPSTCIARLCKRLCAKKAFPHEIGLFLGYPPTDVRGFIDNKAQGYKSIGVWKVYGDEENAEKEFCRYKKCTRIYSGLWKNGKSIERLTVAD